MTCRHKGNTVSLTSMTFYVVIYMKWSYICEWTFQTTYTFQLYSLNACIRFLLTSWYSGEGPFDAYIGSMAISIFLWISEYTIARMLCICYTHSLFLVFSKIFWNLQFQIFICPIDVCDSIKCTFDQSTKGVLMYFI